MPVFSAVFGIGVIGALMLIAKFALIAGAVYMVIGVFLTLKEQFGDFISGFKLGISGLFENVSESMTSMYDNITSTIISIAKIVDAVVINMFGGWKTFGSTIGTILTTVFNMLLSIGTSVSEVFAFIGDSLYNSFLQLPLFLNEVRSLLMDTVLAISKAFSTLVRPIADVMKYANLDKISPATAAMVKAFANPITYENLDAMLPKIDLTPFKKSKVGEASEASANKEKEKAKSSSTDPGYLDQMQKAIDALKNQKIEAMFNLKVDGKGVAYSVEKQKQRSRERSGERFTPWQRVVLRVGGV
jgi:hypothetical protein